MKSRLVPVRCPVCGYTTILKKETYVVASFDDRLKEKLYEGSYFRFHCPKCKSDSIYAHPMLYYDAAKRFVLLLNEHRQETSFQSDILCEQVHTSEDFVEYLHILDQLLYPSQIMSLKEKLHDRYPATQIRFDSLENEVLWFINKTNQGEQMIGIELKNVPFIYRRK